tara:strand:- start:69 stop:224 length:156 start_codon:yes stop_codon:yes gene_type:complete
VKLFAVKNLVTPQPFSLSYSQNIMPNEKMKVPLKEFVQQGFEFGIEEPCQR